MPPFFIMTGEAVALIGAHTIGKVRVEFGSDLAGPWVPGGADILRQLTGQVSVVSLILHYG